MKKSLFGLRVVSLKTTDPYKRVTRCKPWSSYCQPLRLAYIDQLMFIYQPNIYSVDRVVWYGGESTQLHYECETCDANGNLMWIDCNVRTLDGGIPTGVSELHAELMDYYNYCNACVV